MRRLFTQESIVKAMARVEEALLEGLVEAGIAPREALEELRRAKPPSPEEVYEEERRSGHDVASLVFLLGRREALRDLGLNASMLPAAISLLLFLVVDALALSVLGVRIACSSSIMTERVAMFIHVKQLLLLYMWVITAVSWGISSAFSGISVARKAKMRLRKYHYLTALCSLPLTIVGIMNTLVLMISPGRVIPCEGSTWRVLLMTVFSEIFTYLLSFPPIISFISALVSLGWFTYLSYRVHTVTIGLRRDDALKYSLRFTLTFVGSIITISTLIAVLIVLLQLL